MLWTKTAGLIGFLGHDPDSEDHGMDLPENITQRRHRGLEYLESMLKPDYPLHAALFPTKAQVDIFKEQYLPQADAPVDGNGGFRPAAFAGLHQQSQRPADKDAKDAIKLAKQACADFLFCFLPLWSQKHTADADLTGLARLAKAADTPELTGVHMVPGNINLKELDARGLVAIGAGSGWYNRIAKTLGADRPGFSAAHQDKTMPIYCSQTGKVLGKASLDAKGAILITQRPAGITPEAWEKLWGSAKDKIMVVPKSSLYKAKFYDAAKSTAATAGKVLPPVIAVLEAMNFYRSVTAVFEDDVDLIKSGPTIAISTLGFSYYTIDAVKAIIGQKQLTKIMGAPGKFLFEETITILGGEITVFKAWSAGLSGLTASISFYDMTQRASDNDYDAAAAYGLAGAAFIGLSLAKIGAAQIAAAETAGIALSEAGALTFLGPWGWLFLAIGIGATVTATLLTDTGMEQWAKYGPFSANIADRWSRDFKDKSAKNVYAALLDQLMRPRITIGMDSLKTGNVQPDIVVECTVPGYDPDNGRFLLDVTAQNPPDERPMGAEGPDNIYRIRSYDDGDRRQHPQSFHRIELIEKEGVTMGLRYYFHDPSPSDYAFHWRAHARYVFSRGGSTVSLPFTPNTKPLQAYNDIEPNIPGFVYAQFYPDWT